MCNRSANPHPSSSADNFEFYGVFHVTVQHLNLHVFSFYFHGSKTTSVIGSHHVKYRKLRTLLDLVSFLGPLKNDDMVHLLSVLHGVN